MKKSIKKKPDKIVILTIVVVTVTLVIGIFFIYVPYLNNNKTLRSNVLHERDRNILIAKIRANNKHLNVYEKRIPSGRGVLWLLGEVSDMATKEQIEISSIKPGSPEDMKLYTRLYVVLEAICEYAQLGKFISRIESSENFLKVEEINIARLDFDEEFNREATKFSDFDIKSHIVISTIVLKE